MVQRSKAGDPEAFGLLVAHYQNAIFNLVVRMLGNHEDACDVTQEVFVRAFRQIRTFEGRSSLHTWLYSIAVNQAISAARRRSAGVRGGEVQMSALSGKDGPAPYDPPGAGPGPADRMESDEAHRQVQAAIAELDGEHRAVLVLRDVEGLEYDAICKVLRCPRGTVKSRLHRARAELRRKLHHLLQA